MREIFAPISTIINILSALTIIDTSIAPKPNLKHCPTFGLAGLSAALDTQPKLGDPAYVTVLIGSHEFDREHYASRS